MREVDTSRVVVVVAVVVVIVVVSPISLVVSDSMDISLLLLLFV